MSTSPSTITSEQINDLISNNNNDIKIFFRNLFISIIIFFIILSMFNKSITNIINIFRLYLEDHKTIYGGEKLKDLDSYKYYEDDKYFNNNEQILNSIKNIRKSQNKAFNNIKKYKDKYDLDSTNYSSSDRKLLYDKDDNYKYKESPNFIDFILDIFKPTKA